ncbi:MAG: hypothetical protein SOW59_08540 [Corynebacterium sp.]|nr:hypothetical protein [Corynebacterium sp.]
MKISRTATARAKARELFSQREEVLGYLLSAIERQEALNPVIGYALVALSELGITRTELTELSGLSSARIKELIDSAPDHIDGLEFATRKQPHQDAPDETDNTTDDTAYTSNDDY